MARSPSLLETTENTRDLGGHTAPDGRVTRYHVLLRSDVPREEIVADYVLSVQCLRGRLGEVHWRFPQLDMAIVTPCEWYMQQFLSLFLARYGGAEEYLRSRGMSGGADQPSSGQIVIENRAVLWDGPVFLFMLPAAFDKGGWKDARRQR